jgi:predicted RNA-binding Zn-ribbon protein involved in translation (DUF1610 family)
MKNTKYNEKSLESRDSVVNAESPENAHELSFTCPKCGGNELFLRQEALLEVQAVYADGDVEYGDVSPDEDMGYECRDCKYALEDENGLSVFCGEDLAAWLIANCDQLGERVGD